MADFIVRGRVLVVEDDSAVADELADALRHMHFEVVGPFPTADEALASIGRVHVDAAILDVRLRNGMSLPVGRRLRDIGVPFLFMTGSVDDLGDEFADADTLRKPVRLSTLFAALDRILPRQAA